MSKHEEAIRAGNIVRKSWPVPGSAPLALYQGSGRAGGCWNSWGLMGQVEGQAPEAQLTVWSHADHWHHGTYGLDAWLHVGRVVWADRPPPTPKDYRQELSLLDGRLTTSVLGETGRYSLSSWFDPGNPDLLAMEISQDFPGGFPPLLFAPVLEQERGYSGMLKGTANTIEEGPDWRVLRLKIGTADSRVIIRLYDLEGKSSIVADPSGIRLQLPPKGQHLLILGTASAHREAELRETFVRIHPATLAAQAATNWKKRWGKGWVSVPDPNAQALWARSAYYILASYGADVRSPAAPMGWAGSKWPYGFPQDLSYIHPGLLRLGHVDIVKCWVEFYARTIPSMQEATTRIYGAQGVMWAWEYPIGETSKILATGSPNSYQYEIHNAAYPARMAYETTLYLDDPAWSRTVALEVVRESARFYASTLTRAQDGLWDLRVTPSLGQDELDLSSGGNYLCSLFSALYCLEVGVRLAATLGLEDGEVLRWREILRDGLAFPRLLDVSTGIYATREGIDVSSQLGKQKHPIQLNPLFCLPLGKIDEPTREAARRRRDLCIGLGSGASQGWTIHALCLAMVHSGNAEEFQADLELSGTDCNVDPDWLQIYESAGAGPYYITSHGLYLQAMLDAFVSDFSGEPLSGPACPEAWGDVSFGDLHTAGGKVWSGTRRSGKWHVEQVSPVS